MTIERLRCFKAAAEHLNFTRAAEALHMAQTAMSRQIAALEEELGCCLFERSNRAVKLTPAGECFLRGVGPLVDGYDRTVEETCRIGREVSGELRIGIGQYEGRFVSELVAEFCRAYSQTEVTISAHRYQELVSKLLEGDLDVAFALPVSAEYLADRPVEILNLFSSEVCIVVRRDYPLVKEGNFPKEKFQEECLITLSEEDGPCSLKTLKEKMHQGGFSFRSIRCANSLKAELLMVEAGIGIAVIPWFLRDELPKKLTALPTSTWYPGKNQFVAIRRKGEQKPQLDAFWKGISTSHTLWEQMERLKER